MSCEGVDREAPTVAFFVTMFPVFKDVDLTLLEWWRADGIRLLCFKALCPTWERAIYLWMAHHLTVDAAAINAQDAGAVNGQVKRHKTKDVETEFRVSNPVTQTAEGLKATPFGLELLSLQKKYGGMGVMNTGEVTARANQSGSGYAEPLTHLGGFLRNGQTNRL